MATAPDSSPEDCIEITLNKNDKFYLENTKELLTMGPETIATIFKDLHENKGLKSLKMTPEAMDMSKRLLHVDDILNTFTSCDFLVELCFYDIRLRECELIFGDMPLLKSLTLSNCNLRYLDPSVGRLTSLEYISIKGNRFYDLPFTLRFLENLTHFDISLNLFRALPGAFFHLKNLKTITGLHDNLFDQNPKWNKETNFNIISIDPLKKITLLAASEDASTSGQVATLSSLAIKNSVGFNIWAIPLPEQFRTQIASMKSGFDLCECCLKPVLKITEKQETRGYLIKMCMTVFLGTRNVPIRFYACSVECRDKTIEKLTNIQKRLIDECSMATNLPEVVLKEPHCNPLVHKNVSLAHAIALASDKGKKSTDQSKCILS